MRDRGKIVLFAASALAGLGALLVVMILLTGGGSAGETAAATQASTVPAVIATSAASANPHPIAGTFKPTSSTLADCPPLSEGRQACLEQAFGNLAYAEGAKVALGTFAAQIAADPAIESGCHRMAHAIGSASLTRNKGDVGKAFAEGDSTCWSGYYHGILERALYGAASDVVVTRAVRDLCAQVQQTSPVFIYYQCVHGLGHGLMIHFGLDLPKALQFCEKLRTTWDQTSCDGGVFMENFNTSYGVTSRYVKDDDPIYPCNVIAERHKLYCYMQVTDRILTLNSYDFPTTAATCMQSEPEWRGICYQSYGRSVSGNSRLDQARMVELCGSTPEQYATECIYGVVRDITSNDASADRAMSFCKAVAAVLRPRCFYGLGTIVSGFDTTGAELRSTCAVVATAYRDECLQRSDGAISSP
jgi:hypothetical protein